MRVKTATDVRRRVNLRLHQTLPWFAVGIWSFLSGLFGIFAPDAARLLAAAFPRLGVAFDPAGRSGIYVPVLLLERQIQLWWALLLGGLLMIALYVVGYGRRREN